MGARRCRPGDGRAQILSVAAARFGEIARPAAIVLTHGHFDHVGALEPLLAVWDVPVYAHTLELPFLTGRADYPPPDPTVGRGRMSRLSPLFPETRHRPRRPRAAAARPAAQCPACLAGAGSHTPGHSPGHVSLFRAGRRRPDCRRRGGDDAAGVDLRLCTQKQELTGPPAYFTIDWEKSRRSAVALAALRPAVLVTGHGPPIRGRKAALLLGKLARDFDSRARPRRGRYVSRPAVTDARGVVSLPPPSRSGGVRWGMLSGVAAAAFAGTWLVRRFGRRSNAA